MRIILITALLASVHVYAAKSTPIPAKYVRADVEQLEPIEAMKLGLSGVKVLKCQEVDLAVSKSGTSVSLKKPSKK